MKAQSIDKGEEPVIELGSGQYRIAPGAIPVQFTYFLHKSFLLFTLIFYLAHQKMCSNGIKIELEIWSFNTHINLSFLRIKE